MAMLRKYRHICIRNLSEIFIHSGISSYEVSMRAFCQRRNYTTSALSSVPETMRAVTVIKKVGRYDETCRDCFEVRKVPVPEVRAGEVLVRVARSQVNPSDTSFFKGAYGRKLELPSPAGFEGCGNVVRVPEETGNAVEVGSRVSFRGFGTWAEYCTAPVSLCMPLREDTEWANAAGALVNPLTAYTLVERAKERGDRAMVLTAAASGLGRMITRYGLACGVKTIAVVCRPELLQECLDEGAAFALDSSDPDFQEQLQRVCASERCTLGLDAVAGSVAGQVLNSLCQGGKMYVYGGLSGKPVDGVAWSQLIFKGKSMEGFWMTQELNQMLSTPSGAEQARRNMSAVGAMLQTDLRTNVSRTFGLEETAAALMYMRKNMSSGKVQLAVN